MTHYDCPADLKRGESECKGVYDTRNGAVMHGLNKEDDYHSVIQSKPDAYEVLPDEPDSTGGSNESADTPLKPTMPDTDTDDENHVDCPNCGDDLGPESEVIEFIESNGEGYCPNCAHRLTTGDGA